MQFAVRVRVVLQAQVHEHVHRLQVDPLLNFVSAMRQGRYPAIGVIAPNIAQQCAACFHAIDELLGKFVQLLRNAQGLQPRMCEGDQVADFLSLGRLRAAEGGQGGDLGERVVLVLDAKQ